LGADEDVPAAGRVERNSLLDERAVALDGSEAARLDAGARQVAVGLAEGDGVGPAIHPQRGHEHGIVGGLADSRRGDARYARSHDHGVERGMPGYAVLGVPRDDGNPAGVPGGVERGGRRGGDPRVDVDAGHLPVRAGDLGEEGRVVAP
jgi:hypothetical protein